MRTGVIAPEWIPSDPFVGYLSTIIHKAQVAELRPREQYRHTKKRGHDVAWIPSHIFVFLGGLRRHALGFDSDSRYGWYTRWLNFAELGNLSRKRWFCWPDQPVFLL